MALLAEELVEEWLNRQGYFTIRGAKTELHELDLLAVRLTQGQAECRHIEVQSSVRPMSYISELPRHIQIAEGKRPRNATKRTDERLQACVEGWVEKKFKNAKVVALRERLAPSSQWSFEVVLHHVKYEAEVEYIRDCGVTVHRLSEICRQTGKRGRLVTQAHGADVMDLIESLRHSNVPV